MLQFDYKLIYHFVKRLKLIALFLNKNSFVLLPRGFTLKTDHCRQAGPIFCKSLRHRRFADHVLRYAMQIENRRDRAVTQNGCAGNNVEVIEIPAQWF